MTIDEICDLLAKELPTDYTVKLTLENGCACVDVEQWREPDDDMPKHNYGSVESRLLEALQQCKEHAEKNP